MLCSRNSRKCVSTSVRERYGREVGTEIWMKGWDEYGAS